MVFLVTIQFKALKEVRRSLGDIALNEQLRVDG